MIWYGSSLVEYSLFLFTVQYSLFAKFASNKLTRFLEHASVSTFCCYLLQLKQFFCFLAQQLQCNQGERLVHVDVGGGPATGRCERFPLPEEANSNEARIHQCVSAIIFVHSHLLYEKKGAKVKL